MKAMNDLCGGNFFITFYKNENNEDRTSLRFNKLDFALSEVAH
jgi:hypothetical protein